MANLPTMGDRPTSTELNLALSGLLALAAAIGIGRFAFTPILPMMLHDGLLDVAGGGLLASTHFAGYTVGALMATRIGESRLISGSLATIALTTLLMAFSEAMLVWAVARFVAGVCSAFVLVAVSATSVSILAANKPVLQAMVFAGVGIGIAVVGLAVLAMSLVEMSSETAWLAFGVLTLFVAIRQYSLDRHPGRAESRGPSTQSGPAPRLPWALILPYAAMGLG
ncbi:MAG: YbfB/YjiJ family MFS transporter [Pseudomonadota bacterium]